MPWGIKVVVRDLVFFFGSPLLSFLPGSTIGIIFPVSLFTHHVHLQAFSPLCSTANPLCFCLNAFANINSLIQSILSLLFPTAK